MEGRVQRSDNYVESQPNDQQPARPILTVQHKHSGDDLGNPGKMDHPMFLEVGNQLSAVQVEERPQASHQCNSAEDYQQPTDDGDGKWALFHDQRLRRFVIATRATTITSAPYFFNPGLMILRSDERRTRWEGRRKTCGSTRPE